MPVDLYHMPVKCFVLGAQRLKRHNRLRHAVYLNVIAVNERRQIIQF